MSAGGFNITADGLAGGAMAPRTDGGTPNGLATEEKRRLDDFATVVLETVVATQAAPTTRSEQNAAVPLAPRTEPVGGYEDPYWSAFTGFFQGAWDGAKIVTDTATFGQITPLHEHVEQLVEENGGAYAASQMLATASRELLIAAATVGAGTVGTCAGRAAYGSMAFYAAKGVQTFNVARDAYGTVQSAQATYDAYQKGDGWGVVTNAAWTLVGAAGTIADVKALAKACFAAGTLLETPDGFHAIEAFRGDERVLSKPEGDPGAPTSVRRVLRVFQTYAPLLDLRVGGELVRTTAEHPFWVAGRGWTQAHQLVAGDRLVGHDGRETAVEAVEGPGESAPVYNLEVEDDHTYFVGGPAWGFSVWAHNANNYAGAAREGVEAELENVHAPTKVPNPYGKLGSPAHRAKVQDVVADIEARGLQAQAELPIKTINGQKGVRFMDVVAIDPKTNRIVEVHQVGRTLKSDPMVPVARERAALRDVRHAPELRGAKRFFHDYQQ